MEPLSVQLLGRFTLRGTDAVLRHINGIKAQELFCYLALNRERPHNRERLASILWQEGEPEQARKYLRQALWHLQTSLQSVGVTQGEEVLSVDASWVSLNPNVDMDLDTARLERAFALVRDVPGRQLDSDTGAMVREAVGLYRGDLLDGWYHDWCLVERERFQTIYLILLDKLMHHAEARGEYESGIAYGQEILRVDQAREHTHRHLMRLYVLAGDRTSALRQYARCRTVLRDELDIDPEAQTRELAARIRTEGRIDSAPSSANTLLRSIPSGTTSAGEVGTHLAQLHAVLTDVAQQLLGDIETIEQTLGIPKTHSETDRPGDSVADTAKTTDRTQEGYTGLVHDRPELAGRHDQA